MFAFCFCRVLCWVSGGLEPQEGTENDCWGIWSLLEELLMPWTGRGKGVKVAASRTERQMSEEGNQSPQGKSQASLYKPLSVGEVSQSKPTARLPWQEAGKWVETRSGTTGIPFDVNSLPK